MGRKKIKIERITDERNRQVTFNKRKNGLLKKAMELSLLCDSSVALVIMNNSPTAKERVFEYCSSEIDKHLVRYVDVSEPGVIKYANSDYYKLFGKKGSIGSDGDGDSPDEGISQPPLMIPQSSPPHLHNHQESASREALPSNSNSNGSTPPHHNINPHPFNGYPVAIPSHKEHYPIHAQSFEDFLRQSNYHILDSAPSSYFDTAGSSPSVNHDHPSHHGALFCPPIQLSKDLLPPHPHHPPFPFSLGVPIHAHSFPQDAPYPNASHRDRDVTTMFGHASHNHPNNATSSSPQSQSSSMTASSPSSPPKPLQHARIPRDALSMSSDSLSNVSSVSCENKKRKIEISA